jgi:hypothetical protein
MPPFQPRFHQRETRQFEKIPLSQRISAKSLRTATSAQAVTSASRRSEGFKRPGTGTNARVDISRHARDMELGARPVLLAPRPPPPPPSLAAVERFAHLETCRRARAHRRSEMRRSLSEQQAESAALAKAEIRAHRSAKAARERRLDRVQKQRKYCGSRCPWRARPSAVRA